MATININGKELSINMLNADVVERYETLNKKIGKDIQDPALYKGKSNAEGMRAQIKLIDQYLDDLFGEGTAQSVFGDDKGDLEKRVDAFAQCSKLGQTGSARIEEIAGRYGFNRAARRAAAKK